MLYKIQEMKIGIVRRISDDGKLVAFKAKLSDFVLVEASISRYPVFGREVLRDDNARMKSKHLHQGCAAFTTSVDKQKRLRITKRVKEKKNLREDVFCSRCLRAN